MPNDEKPSGIRLAPVVDTGEFAELLDSDRFAQIQRVAKLFSESTLIPETFQGKPANCAVALQMAFRMRIDPMLLMQSMYVVSGRPGIEAKLAIALMNQRGPFTGPLQWEIKGEGNDRSWTCYATHKTTGEKCSMTVTWKMAVAEGWVDKKGSKWVTIPDLMGRYRSAAWLGRVYCPEVLLGLPFDDELLDRPDHEIVTPGERVDEIPMPTAKAEPAYKSVDQMEREARAAQKPPETAENGAQASATEAKAIPVAEELQMTDGGTISARPEGTDLLDQAVAADPMQGKRLASKAQRDMIVTVATKHGGMTEAQLNELLADKFSFTLATLPTSMVNEALQFLTKRNA